MTRKATMGKQSETVLDLRPEQEQKESFGRFRLLLTRAVETSGSYAEIRAQKGRESAEEFLATATNQVIDLGPSTIQISNQREAFVDAVRALADLEQKGVTVQFTEPDSGKTITFALGGGKDEE